MAALEDALRDTTRALALPGILLLRWIGHANRTAALEGRGAVSLGQRLLHAPKIVADELFLASEILASRLPRLREYARRGEEVEAAVALIERRGWLAEPTRFHRAPPLLREVETRERRSLGTPHLHLAFESGFTPRRELPGRERWQGYEANRTAHAWLLRHPGPPRPWLVCIPGFRMGHPAVDFTGFRARWLHRELGLNVAIPVLPFHGPRRVGRRGGDGFLAGDFLDTLHAKTQAVWDVRRLIGWLRLQDAPAVGLYGLSLGSTTASVVAALEDEIDGLIVGIPASNFVSLLRWNMPAGVLAMSERLGFPWARIETLLRVVSPLAFDPRVPRERRFLYAGRADRLAPPEQAHRLWEHWGRPRLAWYDGSHVSFLLEPAARALLLEALEAAGLRAAPSAAASPNGRR